MEEEEKYTIRLVKQPLKSEREENRRKTAGIVVTFIVAILFMALTFIGGYYVAGMTNSYYYSDDSSKFTKILDLIRDEWLYASEYEDLEKTLNDKAYYGMTDFASDPYTTYMSSDDLESFTSGINMDYVGIGVQYISTYGVPEIIRVYNDSPAEHAGILPGDIIVQVDDVRIDESNIADLKSYVLGEEGSVVKITVLRSGKEEAFEVIRGEVDSTVFAKSGDGYDYLNIVSFGDGTAKEVEKYLQTFKSGNLIIDLRDDSGGYQTAVQAIAGLFIGPSKVYMKQVDNTGEQYDDYTSAFVTQYTFDKIIVLVNNNTASAAEVLTICLKEQLDNVTIVGTSTFGKGVVQSTFMVEGDSAVKITTSKWLSPIKGLWINGVGIQPDVEVKLHDIIYMSYMAMDEEDSYGYDSCSGYVEIAELALDYLGYSPDRTDGYFSKDAVSALAQYKNDLGLENPEILDKDTYHSLISAVIYQNSTNYDRDLQMIEAVKLVKE